MCKIQPLILNKVKRGNAAEMLLNFKEIYIVKFLLPPNTLEYPLIKSIGVNQPSSKKYCIYKQIVKLT